jgi:peptidoglycan/LPS O-acetylase OafA/YrhL
LDNIIIMPFLIIPVLIVGFISYRMVEKPLLKLSRRIA